MSEHITAENVAELRSFVSDKLGLREVEKELAKRIEVRDKLIRLNSRYYVVSTSQTYEEVRITEVSEFEPTETPAA